MTKINVVDKDIVTNVNFILDMSGSMGSVWDATIEGFNEYLAGLRKDGNNYKISLTLFDDVVEKPYVNLPLKDVNDLTKDVYTPRGMTALYDAVCKTVNELPEDSKNLVVIMTDGGENASREFTQNDFVKTKNALDKENKTTFVFLGANQDAWSVASQWGFSKSNVANYNSTTVGTRAAFQAMSVSTAAFASAGDWSSQEFMSADQIKTVEDTK